MAEQDTKVHDLEGNLIAKLLLESGLREMEALVETFPESITMQQVRRVYDQLQKFASTRRFV